MNYFAFHSKIIYCLTLLLLSACAVGPEYKRPNIVVAENYKEGKISWKRAHSNIDIDRGQWWKIFKDPILDDLIDKLNKNNQDIASLNATYQQSLSIVDKARAAYFPDLSATHAITSQKTNEQKSLDRDTSSHSISLDASWEADVWSKTKYSVASNLAAAKADKAELASKILSSQSSLTQYYFELRGTDKNQQLLDAIVSANQKTLQYTKSNYKAGVMDQSALLNAENALHTSESNAYNNKITRAQYQHAIAVLIGESPSSFTLSPIKDYQSANVSIPVSLPSELLENRPDIIQAEELMKQANAQIGIATTAFFPSVGLSSNLTASGDGLGNLLSMPNLIWSLGPQMALTLIDGGSRMAQTKSAQAGYQAAVASYKQTILSAFSEVEDQLSSLEYLNSQVKSLNKAANNSKQLFDISFKQYSSGTVDYSQTLNAQINYYNSKKSATDLEISKRSSEIALIKALGGDWNNQNF